MYLIHMVDKGNSGSDGDSVCANLKHRIVQYIFLDITSYICGDKWAMLIEHLVSEQDQGVNFGLSY